MLKVAIVGCGKIADSHLTELRRVQQCAVVAVVDREILMAEQLAERFGVPKTYDDVAAMLSRESPDVVHITTPPAAHLSLGLQCLEAGSHVYMEKPFTLNAEDAVRLIDAASSLDRKITAGHDLQFSTVATRTRQLVRSGYLGGNPLHIESYYCYDLSDAAYAKALLGDRRHWVRGLPGGLLQNVISHGIARIAEYVPTQDPFIFAHGFTSGTLRSLGETEIQDELRVTISDRKKVTAYFTFSSQMFPSLNQLRLYGPKNGLIADEDHQTLVRLPGKRMKSYAEKFISPLGLGRQYASNVFHNSKKFLRGNFHMKAGMKTLIDAFYSSIRERTPPPIPYSEILLTARIMDSIFDQLNPERAECAATHCVA